MQKTATTSTSCRTNVETETLILSQVVHQVQEPACRPVGRLWPSAGRGILASSCRMEHEAGVEPACFGFKAQRGCRQPTTRVLAQAAGIGPAWAAFRAQLGCQQPTPE